MAKIVRYSLTQRDPNGNYVNDLFRQRAPTNSKPARTESESQRFAREQEVKKARVALIRRARWQKAPDAALPEILANANALKLDYFKDTAKMDLAIATGSSRFAKINSHRSSGKVPSTSTEILVQKKKLLHMRAMKPVEVLRRLQQLGVRVKRQGHGSHVILESSTKTVPLSIHKGAELSWAYINKVLDSLEIPEPRFWE